MDDPLALETMPLRFVGGRFALPGMPIDALVELSAFRDAVRAVARAEFLHANTDRQRVPKGFDVDVDLRLIRIDEGSALPVFAIAPLASDGQLFDRESPVRHAISVVTTALARTAAGENPIDHGLPPQCLPLVERIGRSYKGTEAIEFASADGGVVRYDRQARRRLTLVNNDVFEAETTRFGQIHELDLHKMSCQVELQDDRRSVLVALDVQTYARAYELMRPETQQLAQLDGVAEFDSEDRLLRFAQPPSIEAADDITGATFQRLDEISLLEQGWLDGDGALPLEAALSAARRVLPLLTGIHDQRPRIGLDEDGRVEAEWTIGNVVLGVTFTGAATVEVQTLDLIAKRGGDQEFDEADIDAVVNHVLNVAGSSAS